MLQFGEDRTSPAGAPAITGRREKGQIDALRIRLSKV
jgi:hypothetical protein